MAMGKEKLAGIGAATAAGIGSVCCIGPLVLSSLGLGAGALGFVNSFGILHLPMTILALSLLGTALYLKFRKPAGRCAAAECCDAVPGRVSGVSVSFWLAACLTAVFLLIPYVV